MNNDNQRNYFCDICGRETFKKISYGGYVLCSKHMHQLYKYGEFLDDIPRTNNDLNDYVVEGDIAIFNVYNQKNRLIDTFTIDKEDLEKVKYRKWRKSHSHIVTGQPAKGQQKELSHIVLGISEHDDFVVDHINGDACNNTKENLRICSQRQNTLNKSFISNNTSGFIGVSFRKDRDRYDPEIRLNGIRCHLGYEKSKEDAVYKRYYAEQLVFKDFANRNEQERKKIFTINIPEERKKELRELTIKKLEAKKLLGN